MPKRHREEVDVGDTTKSTELQIHGMLGEISLMRKENVFCTLMGR